MSDEELARRLQDEDDNEERKRREDLEKRVNDLVQENHRSRQIADEAERSSSIRTELQRLGVAKVDLAYRAVKDDIQRRADDRGHAEERQLLSVVPQAHRNGDVGELGPLGFR